MHHVHNVLALKILNVIHVQLQIFSVETLVLHLVLVDMGQQQAQKFVYYVIVSVLLAHKTQHIALLVRQARQTNLFSMILLVWEHVLPKHMLKQMITPVPLVDHIVLFVVILQFVLLVILDMVYLIIHVFLHVQVSILWMEIFVANVMLNVYYAWEVASIALFVCYQELINPT